jgi:hypothetical protein
MRGGPDPGPRSTGRPPVGTLLGAARVEILRWHVERCRPSIDVRPAVGRATTCVKDTELADLFRKAQADSRKGADIGKRLLRSRLDGA